MSQSARSSDPLPVLRDGDPPFGQPSVVSVGVFDGVHLGHRSILARARADASRRNLPLVVLTFDPHPVSVLRPEASTPQLTTLRHKLGLLAELGVDAVRLVTFSREVAGVTCEEFAAEYLRRQLSAKLVVVGSNFRFGHMAVGDVALLTELGELDGFSVDSVGLAADESGSVWSSTAIRALVMRGDVAEASVGLARPHRVEGMVVPGDGRGKSLGFPTANVAVHANSSVPHDGVYAAWLVVDPYGEPRRHAAAVSVGANVTFGGAARRVEAHALDRTDLELGGKYVAVDFIEHLRPMRKFDSVTELKAAIAWDVKSARGILTG
ncbi:MAG: bifunctional riboflavin kinase/FAD synthetase [Candidatus Nanopelagicales bacterium]|nr:bifunctional riboflavin kinase/FAD synthetase [Candidatus Nanopelagicales bacterium]